MPICLQNLCGFQGFLDKAWYFLCLLGLSYHLLRTFFCIGILESERRRDTAAFSCYIQGYFHQDDLISTAPNGEYFGSSFNLNDHFLRKRPDRLSITFDLDYV